ncbi:ATP-binding protein [Nitrosomonas sp. ANs5]|uniref:ATP-binding protein n=1 Tax=Nitrosomonas sp. ANs5 TaxID=3423941 RepID=UPI003D34CAA2
MPNKTVVEFIGIPGSGKSTIAKALYENFLPSSDVIMPMHGFRRVDLTFFEKVSVDLRYLSVLFPYRFRRVLYELRYFGYNLVSIKNGWERSRYPSAFFELVKKLDAKLIILDEWLIHRTIDEDVHRYQTGIDYVGRFSLAPLSNIDKICYVLVKTNPEIAFKRILSEDQPYRHFALNKDKCRIRKVLANWEQDVKEVSAALEAQQIPLLMINGSDPVEKNVQLLTDLLRRQVS